MNKCWLYDERMNSYKSFFDHAWAKSFLDLVDGTGLKQPAFDLCVSWRGASNTYALPWLLASMVQNTLQEKIRKKDPYGIRYITRLRDGIVGEMRIPLQRDQRKELQRVMEKLHKKSSSFSRVVKQTPIFQSDELWKGFLKNSEFQFALLGSQRMCFGAIYYAYEDYLRQCVGLALGKSKYRMDRRFTDDLAATLGKSICERCWTDREINVARITRNALVHNGCRETEELRKAKHSFQISKGEIQIMAEHTSSLYHALKDRVNMLTVETLKNPNIK